MRLRTAVLSISTLLLFGTMVQAAQPPDAAQVTRMRAALAAPERSAENKSRDEGRKPIETVQFFGIKSGDIAVDMIAAAGWFTEVLSAAVGPSGHVYMQNPPFFPETDAEKALIKRLGNVEALRVPFAQAGVVAKADVVVTAMNLHDVYNGFQDQPAGEPAAVEFLKSIHAALEAGRGARAHRPRGRGGAGQQEAASHAAPASARCDHEGGIHDRSGIEAARESGGRSHQGVFDPALRGHTDQFMIRARKPR